MEALKIIRNGLSVTILCDRISDLEFMQDLCAQVPKTVAVYVPPTCVDKHSIASLAYTLRWSGWAVSLLSPFELGPKDPDVVEDAMRDAALKLINKEG